MSVWVRVIWATRLLSGFSYGEELPKIFEKSELVKLPISSGRSSYGGVYVSSPKSISHGSVPKNEDSYGELMTLHRHLMSVDEDGIFSFNNKQWYQYKKANMEGAKFWGISHIPCPHSLVCYLLSPDSGMWLIIGRGREMTDFQLVNANQYKIDEKGYAGAPVAHMDTLFGEVGLFPYPETDYEKTGIFCSVLTTTLPSGEEKVQIFKRRITPDGKIENKALPEGARECKLPW